MKTFKRALSGFLAMLMIFGTFSVLSTAAEQTNGYSATIETKFYVQNAEGGWDLTEKVKAGDKVKARVFATSDYYLGASSFFWVYSKNFMDFDPTGLSGSAQDGYDAAGIFNTSATSIPVTNSFKGNFVVRTEVPEYSAADDMVYEGYVDPDYFDDKGWIKLDIKNFTPAILKDTEYLFEFNFKVKDTPSVDEGFFYVPTESICTPVDSYAPTMLQRATSTTDSGIDSDDFPYVTDYNISTKDDNVITLFTETSTTYTQNVYTMDTSGDYGEAVTTTPTAEIGASVKAADYTVPAGFTLDATQSTTSVIAAADGSAVMNVYLSRNKYTVKFGDVETQQYYDAVIVPEEAPPMTGYTFDGWYIGNTKLAATDKVPVGGATYTAKYTGNEGVAYTVKKYFMNTDGETYADAVEETLTGKAGEIANYAVAVDGFTLNSTKGKLAGTIAGDGSLVLEAYYDRKTVKVTVNGETEDMYYGEEIQKPDDPIPNTGYEFDKWVDGTDKEIETWPVVVGTSDIIIKPIYKAIERTITYVYAGEVPAGMTAPAAVKGIIGDTVVVPAVPTATGYTASAWVVDGADENGKVYTSDVTVTTTWSINAYGVTFDTDGGSPVAAIENVKYGDQITADMIGETTKPGYDFVEWTYADGTAVTFPITMGDAAVTLKATWKLHDYNITYSFTGNVPTGVTEPAATTGTKGSDIPLPKVDAVTGYTFGGWTTIEGADENGKVGTSDITVSGAWTINQHTITYVTGVDTTIAPATRRYGVEILAPSEALTKAGYTFAGWKDQDDNVVTFPFSMPDKDLTLTAQWTAVERTITYVYAGDVPEGKEAPAAVKGIIGDTVVVPEIPTATGYTASAWVVEGADADGKVAEQNVTVTTTWAINKYTVTFYADEEGVDNNTVHFSKEYSYGDTFEYPATNPSKPGAQFSAWDTTISDVEDNMDIYPIFTYDVYDVVIIGLYDTEIDAYTAGYGDQIIDGDLPSDADMEEDGYKFNGWKVNGADLVLPYTITGDTTIVAEYEALDAKIIYDADGGVFAENNSDTYVVNTKYDAEITADMIPADPTKTGYRFDGWDQEIGDIVDSLEKTITATWLINKYTVKFVANDKVILETELDYGAKITAPAAPDYAGHTFDAWYNGEVKYATTDTVPASDVTYTAKYISDDDVAYTVKKYFMNTDGATYAAPVSETLYGTADETVSYNTAVEGFTLNTNKGKLSGEIAGDGSLVLEAYYDRNTVQVTIDGAKDSMYYGEEIQKPEANPETGYELDKWVDGDGDEITTWPVTVGTEDIVITPVYKKTERTITYVYAGDVPAGKEAPAAVKGVIGDTVVVPEVPTATGYTASAWVVEGADADGKVYTSDVTVTTTWTIDKYTVKFIADGQEVYNEELAYGTTIVAPADPVKAGYTFNGWFNGDVEYTDADKVGTADVTYTAKFTGNEGVGYTVKKYFMYTDGSSYAAPEEEALTGKAGETVSYNTAVEGFTLNTGKGKLSGEIAGDGSLVLEAYYDRNTVQVTIDGAKDSMYYGETINKPADPTPAPGYEFDTWVDGNDDEITSWPITVGTEDIVIKPTFTAIERTITYVYAGEVPAGKEAPAAVKGIIGDTVVVPEVPTADGYTASAWVVEGADADGKVYTSDVTVTTTWTINKFTVTFYADEEGKTVHATKEYAYGETLAYPDSNPAKTGYDFAAWNVAEGTEVKSAIEVYPTFTINTYTLSFEVDGAAFGETTDVVYGSAITAPEAPDKSADGKTFAGWYDKETNTKMPATMPAKNATYVAVYSDNDTAQYAIKVYIMDTEGNYTLSATTYHTAASGSVQSVTPGEWVGCTVDSAKSVLTATVSALGDTVLEVYYARNIYTVTYDGAAPIEVYYGAAVPTVEPVAQAGKVFTGWTPAVPATMPAENLEFTSTWDDATYTVTYIVNGQATEVGYAYNATVEAPANPSIAGMKFTGWIDTDGNAVTFPFAMPAEDLTITAKFETAFYTATYIADGEVFAAYSVSYGGQIPVPESTPTKEFYTFDSWTAIPGKMPAHDVEIEAIFTPVPVRLIAAPGSTTVIDRDNKIIYGLDTMLTAAVIDEDFLDVEGDGTLVITGVTSTRYGTGTVVEVIDNNTGAVVETYHIVVFGDVNGDSIADATDVSIIRGEAYFRTDWSFETEYVDGTEVDNADYDYLKLTAGDLNGDGRIDATDLSLVNNAVLGMVTIDQVEGKVVRS